MDREDFSDFVFYADESGDHSLTSIDRGYPIFCLAVCAFDKRIYSRSIVPGFQSLKFRYFGHDAVILHERDIRKQINDFTILIDREVETQFHAELARLVERSPFRIFACVIEKERISADMFPEHPYHVSLKMCLQCADRFLEMRSQQGRISHFIFERRGAREDKELELEFLRIVSGQNDFERRFDGFRLVFVDKKANSTGLQIADLVARPTGVHVLRPGQGSRAFAAFRSKFQGMPANAYGKRGIHVVKKAKGPG
ncbi:DUF3800 domain-containing protein [Jiella avicenniae]|uniref:DUF3800 domain-containing protein n=1 Tax=Jiella avicenniae TaxID=2907202 RepID=A0A9X1TDQ4_9HYPH|nr:DUF3800 domain-containing protein [Jiella avicenniae]MCE7030418.1 DUF3800 domain-containing protein [Jiella avicenniae]